MSTWALAGQSGHVAALAGYSGKFYAFWIIVVVILALIIGLPIMFMRKRGKRVS